ncbi:unnamed protein product [Cyprideis torosa]|uniref:Phospholipase B-like n=1 Tax=Cyprideis torosa TaxID=163714 RepID=A0A7R8ZSP4_9CRUS|nr:unnamed protein product [Cyprideis torosa]CAG0895996.1 unnamed protein product [Cyprideis torosa]
MVQKQQFRYVAGKQARSSVFIDYWLLGERRRLSDPSKKDPDRPPYGSFALPKVHQPPLCNTSIATIAYIVIPPVRKIPSGTMRYLAPLLLSLPCLVTSTASVDSFHSFSTSTAEKPRGSPVVAYVNYAGGDFQITPEFTQTDCLAVGNYTDTTFLNGWTNLEVRTRNIPGKDGSPQDQAYAAGMVEGFLTAPIISNAWRNTMQNFCDEKDGRTKQVCSAINSFLLTNLAWMQRMISANPNDPYWHQMDLILNQLQGMADGYGRAREVYSEGKLMKLDYTSFL